MVRSTRAEINAPLPILRCRGPASYCFRPWYVFLAVWSPSSAEHTAKDPMMNAGCVVEKDPACRSMRTDEWRLEADRHDRLCSSIARSLRRWRRTSWIRARLQRDDTLEVHSGGSSVRHRGIVTGWLCRSRLAASIRSVANPQALRATRANRARIRRTPLPILSPDWCSSA